MRVDSSHGSFAFIFKRHWCIYGFKYIESNKRLCKQTEGKERSKLVFQIHLLIIPNVNFSSNYSLLRIKYDNAYMTMFPNK